MTDAETIFRADARRAARDPAIEARFRMVAQRHGEQRRLRIAALGNFAQLREQLNRVKETVLADHDRYLALLQEQIEALGGTVHLAQDAAAARRIIGRIAETRGVKIAVKSKSMTSEEVALTPSLEDLGVEVLETDLGEFIIQLAGEPPSHIVLPAIHKTKEEIAQLFAEKLGRARTDDPLELAHMARRFLRQKFLAADLGLTGANALVAENGALMLVENEGNIRLTTTLPRIHVALAGIEKIVPSMADLALLLKLLPRSATGQKMSGYVSLIRGPGRADERDGSREFHLVLLDNGRSHMRADPALREALKCIRCGACLNACPVYQHIGGHAYGTVYPGPIGAMITQALNGPDHAWLLPFASSLCGACTEVCPAKIPIHSILVELRSRAFAGPEARSGIFERAAFRAWSEFWQSPAGYRLSTRIGATLGGLISDGQVVHHLPAPGDAWTEERDLPAPAKKPFHERWQTLSAELSVEKERALPESAQATQPRSQPPEPPPEPRAGAADQFARELRALQAEVHTARGIAEAREQLAKILSAFSGRSLVAWNHPDLELLGLRDAAARAGMTIALAGNNREDFISAAASAEVGVTAADFALAETGTLALLTKPGQERSLSLLPPVHLAVVRRDQIIAGIENLFPALDQIGADFRGLTLVSGPSLTGDIEMVLVLGMHGPGRLIVLLWSES